MRKICGDLIANPNDLCEVGIYCNLCMASLLFEARVILDMGSCSVLLRLD